MVMMMVGAAYQRTGGMEDWDFTLKLMNENLWGYTIPEFVFWYRTRVSHADRYHYYHYCLCYYCLCCCCGYCYYYYCYNSHL